MIPHVKGTKSSSAAATGERMKLKTFEDKIFHILLTVAIIMAFVVGIAWCTWIVHVLITAIF